jgi:patatin-like phospholipase/acyl hydrolase
MTHCRVLSIDGGGLKGLFSISFLATIEKQLGKRIVDYFDLLVGTSTGGIIALALGVGFSAEEILDFYNREGDLIFPGGRFAKSMRSALSLFRPKYSALPLEDALKKYFMDLRLGDSKTRLVIPAFNPKTGDVYLYKTAHHPRFREDYKELIWKVARATAAAPTYLRSFKAGFLTDLVDGGVWANNPSMVAVTEAIGLLGREPADIALLSIGTSLTKVSIPEKTAEAGGLLSWGSAIPTQLFMHLQTLIAHKQATHILERGLYVRIDPSTCDIQVPMDDLRRASVLIPIGEQAARHCRPKIEDSFFYFKRDDFVPLYRLEVNSAEREISSYE